EASRPRRFCEASLTPGDAPMFPRLWWSAVWGLFVCLPLWGDEKPQPVDTRPLLAIRPLGSPLTVKADAPRFTKLEDYYLEANPRLRARLDELKKTFLDRERGYGVTFVSAPAGAGKSFLFRSFSKSVANHIYAVDLTRMDAMKVPVRRVLDLHPL